MSDSYRDEERRHEYDREEYRRKEFWRKENAPDDARARHENDKRFWDAVEDDNQMGVYAALGLTPPGQPAASADAPPEVAQANAALQKLARYVRQRDDAAKCRQLLLGEINLALYSGRMTGQLHYDLVQMRDYVISVNAEREDHIGTLERMRPAWEAWFGSSISSSLRIFIKASRMLMVYKDDLSTT